VEANREAIATGITEWVGAVGELLSTAAAALSAVNEAIGGAEGWKALAEVVEPRYDELFTLVRAELQRSGYESMMTAGIVLTGGTAKMEGAVELAEEIFHMPVRLGVPQNVHGLADIIANPVYATAVGLLQHGFRQHEQRPAGGGSRGPAVGNLLSRLKQWFQHNL